jgi:hypothetical protein
MNLESLWHHERNRIATLIDEPNLPNNTPQYSYSRLTEEDRSKKNSDIAQKKLSTFLKRDLISKRLLEECVTPVILSIPNLFDSNGFAMEYEDHAPKRLYGPISNDLLGVEEKLKRKSSSMSTSQAIGGTESPQKKEIRPISTPKLEIPQKESKSAKKNQRGKPGSGGKSNVLRPYRGDMFGTHGEYVDGMLYMSRMKKSHQMTFGEKDTGRRFDENSATWNDLSRSEGRHALKDTVSDAFKARDQSTALSADEISGEENARLKQRQRCSLTLSNWSSNPDNAKLMVEENVVEALISLCKTEDKSTKINCMTAFMNLSHVCELRQVIVQQGAVKTIAEILNETDDKTLRTASAISLCNLCCLEGEEERLVEDGAVGALSLLMNEHPEVANICHSALFNLTCVSSPYQKIESVLKVFITLVSSSAPSTPTTSAVTRERDLTSAKALCNLSNFKRIRYRLLEEGIVSTLSSLVHTPNPEIQNIIAYILLNLSGVQSCRGELVAKGAMAVLGTLAQSAIDPDTKYAIGSALWNLSKEVGSRLRMVFEGVLIQVNEISHFINNVDQKNANSIRSVCARTIYNISCSEDTRIKLVERDAVVILNNLSKLSASGDSKKMCTLALCNLLSVQQAAADIVTAGAITSLIELSMIAHQSVETRQLFSYALYGLCEQEGTREAVTKAGIIPAIVCLCSGTSSSENYSPRESINNEVVDTVNTGSTLKKMCSEIRGRCMAALACLAADERSRPHMCNVEVVRCVSQTLQLERSSVLVERFCCSCLSLLCRDEKCSLLMVEQGSIEAVLSTCMETNDLETKACCCHVLASMSFHPSCCMPLVRMGVISVLATLAKIRDAGIQRCCASTLANLSGEREIRSILSSASTVPILSILSASYSEESQKDCAKILCNLSSLEGSEQALVKEGAVSVLLMISMVRALSPLTKETCLKALVNLFTRNTAEDMVREGLVKVLSPLTSLESVDATEISTLAFGKLLSLHPAGREALCSEKSALRSLFALMERSTLAEAKVSSIHENMLCELVYYDNSRNQSVQSGIIDALHKIAMRTPTKDNLKCSYKRLALVLLTLSRHEATRIAIASTTSIATLIRLLKPHKALPSCQSDCVLYAVAALCYLSWFDSTRDRLDHPEISMALVNMLTGFQDENQNVGYPFEAIKICLLTLCCLSESSSHCETMLNAHIIDYLYSAFELRDPPHSYNTHVRSDSEFASFACILLRQLSHSKSFLYFVQSNKSTVITLICTLSSKIKDDEYSGLDLAEALCAITFSESIPPALLGPSVYESIKVIMTSTHLSETRWRCTASIWALSCVPSYRSRLVESGYTRLLVDQAYTNDFAGNLETLRCCAGALCNLTIVPHDASDANSAKMVEQEAVPALLHLSRLENEGMKESCTVALSNLSKQSPKVQSGAVSALLNLSLRENPPGAYSTRHLNATTIQYSSSTLSNCKPPSITNMRHKEFAKLPDYELTLEDNSDFFSQKYEAKIQASTPAAPHVPLIPVVLPDGGASSQDEERGKKSSSYGDISAIFNGGVQQTSSASDHDDPKPPRPVKFEKVDPSQSHCKSDGYGDKLFFEKEQIPEDYSIILETPEWDQVVEHPEPISPLTSNMLSHGHTQAIATYTHTKGNGEQLSPLTRVVAKKQQAHHTIKKSKEIHSKSERKVYLSGDSGEGNIAPESSSFRTNLTLPHQQAKAKGSKHEQECIEGSVPMHLKQEGGGGDNSSLKKAKSKSSKRKGVGASDEIDVSGSSENVIPSTTIEEFQEQAKRFGLWS